MYQEKTKAILKQNDIEQPTLIQKQTYEAIKNGASLVALAKTGTGKTLAYALPIIERAASGNKNSIVILLPTTELAVQVRRAISPYAAGYGLKCLSLVGAGNRKRQEEKLKKKKAEILLATPGRFMDFFSAGRIKLNEIKTLVIDEADDVLEFAKREFLTALGQNLPQGSQILLFGATASSYVLAAESEFKRHFLLIDVRKQQKSRVKHYFLQVDNRHKIEFLQRLTKLDNFKGILFFDSQASLQRFASIFRHTQTKFAVLSNEDNKISQAQALAKLEHGQVRLLFATDLAARGLDIPTLTYAINFEIPQDSTTYLHRSGRVGRMNQEGITITLGDDHDLRNLKKIMAGIVNVSRVYFAGFGLTTKKPNKKKKHSENISTTKKKKKHKKKQKNKGYHPHYLKEKK